MGPKIYLSKRFRDSYDRAIVLRNMAEGTVHDFVRAYRSDPTTCARKYDRVAGINQNVLEFDVGCGERMLGLWQPPRLTLLDLGGHEVTSRLRRTDVRHAKDTAVQAPISFYPETRSFFLSTPDLDWTDYRDRERLADWAYYLDDQQAEIANSIFESSLEVLVSNGRPQVHLVLGGPGTGKTCILLHLLKSFSDLGSSVYLEMPDQVADYVHKSAYMDVGGFRPPAQSRGDVDIVLVDDPAADREITSLARVPKTGRARVVVIAADPLQFENSLPDETFDALVRRHKIHLHQLTVCYRQKAEVGEVSKRAAEIIAQSTPYLVPARKRAHWDEHARLTSLCNDLLEFPNPHGYRLAYPEASLQDFRTELARVKSHQAGQWGRWPQLLVAAIDQDLGQVPTAWNRELHASGLHHQVLGAEELGKAKGVEYQHVFLLMYGELFAQLNDGFEGSGRNLYKQRRLLRIPYSRAKDSLVILSLPRPC